MKSSHCRRVASYKGLDSSPKASLTYWVTELVFTITFSDLSQGCTRDRNRKCEIVIIMSFLKASICLFSAKQFPFKGYRICLLVLIFVINRSICLLYYD